MRIALFAPSWPPGSAPNGIVTYTSHLVPALRRLGHEVYILTFSPLDATDPYTIDLKAYAPAQTLLSRLFRRLAPARSSFEAVAGTILTAITRLIEAKKIDIFEMEESFGWTGPTSSKKIVPVVVRLHGPWVLTGRFNDAGNEHLVHRGKVEREGRAIASAQFVTANCNETLNFVKNHYGLRLPNSCVIPTPIEAVPEARRWDVERCAERSILFVGRFDKLKGGDLVLRAFAQLSESYPELTLTFVGPDIGIKDERGTVLKFDQYARRHIPEHVRSRIDFRGLMKHADLMELRPRHYLTLIAAQYDTMGYMLLEPMSYGCPIVSTAVGGIPEVIEDGRNGLLVPSQDAEAMVGACRRLLDDPALAAGIGRQAWEDCRTVYAPDSVARQTVAAYQRAIDAFGR